MFIKEILKNNKVQPDVQNILTRGAILELNLINEEESYKLKIPLLDNNTGKIVTTFTKNNVSPEALIGDLLLVSHFNYKGEKANKRSEAAIVIDQLMIGRDATTGNLYYIKDDAYWGRRGPSVHLNYPIPESASDIAWLHSEITVPEGNDFIGSYFMANGFKEGYFGMQVNLETERRFLFSVWSPYKTNNPKDIPKDQQIILLKKGKDVIAGEFWYEESGEQSYRKYLWKADTTYKFLLKGVPFINNFTDYTAFVFALEKEKWELMASFRYPKTITYLKNLHSFLENFQPDMGNKVRKSFYTNQWVYDTKNTWYSITDAKFRADATARKNVRLDYSEGIENNKYYLKNYGFFSNTTAINSVFKIETTKKKEALNLDFHLLEGLIE
ncbi:DUF3472 domain-containing protein [Snuella sedimenti]|uniref:DUF3472 domain-containing protein n=1 Tax=Snuella sedimenti TaxID=2798802 RepID=UPI001E3A9595|nr:DUF3472 domain-containing protein [Snuella sedimenti]